MIRYICNMVHAHRMLTNNNIIIPLAILEELMPPVLRSWSTLFVSFSMVRQKVEYVRDAMLVVVGVECRIDAGANFFVMSSEHRARRQFTLRNTLLPVIDFQY
jgi:hypothetical protein